MISYTDVKEQISVSDVLSQYGLHVPDHGHYRIPCPIHRGTNRNFSVNERRGLFKCFKCGAAGTVLDLVASLEGTTIAEAADKLASGISEYRIDPGKIRATQRQVERWVSYANTSSLEVGVPYELRDLPAGYRNLSKTAIDHFRLSLTDQGVFIPHFNLLGKRVGYSIRHPDGVLPKYLNNVGFPKHIPYGLYQNRDYIIKSGFAIVVEGQFDCLTMWDRGYRNVVALMGSSMSDQQAHLFLSLTTRLKLLFDGDKPGRIGAAKTSKKWGRCFDLNIELLPNGIDPAEYLAETAGV